MTGIKPAGASAACDRALAPAAHDWRDDALRAEISTDLFFPGTGHEAQAKIARSVCRRCPVQSPCLEYALEYEERRDTKGRHGIFGGMSSNEREAVARARKRDAA